MESSTRLDEVVEQLGAGSVVVAILLAMSVVALAVIVLKAYQLWSARLGSARFVDLCVYHWREGRPRKALDVLSSSRSPLAHVMGVAIRLEADGQMAGQLVREEVSREALRVVDRLREHLRILEVVGTASPLLGLLGTVLGMIEAFRQIESAGARVDPGLLSGGIWTALLTTAIGLVVAIPAVVALHGFDGAVERYRRQMEDAVTRLFTQAPEWDATPERGSEVAGLEVGHGVR